MPANVDPPAFQFYPRDWVVDTRHLSREERGRYFDALCDSWVSRSYGVAHEDQWRQWLGYAPEEWVSARDTYARFFKIKADGVWVQQRMHSERCTQRRRHDRASVGGKTTQQRLRDKRLTSIAPAELKLGLNHAPTPDSASASAVKTKTLRAARAAWTEAFTQFWEAYPRKQAKVESLRVWAKLQPAKPELDEDTFNRIMDGLEADVALWRDEKREARYTPLPSTWLNQRRFEDHAQEAM